MSASFYTGHVGQTALMESFGNPQWRDLQLMQLVPGHTRARVGVPHAPGKDSTLMWIECASPEGCSPIEAAIIPDSAASRLDDSRSARHAFGGTAMCRETWNLFCFTTLHLNVASAFDNFLHRESSEVSR